MSGNDKFFEVSSNLIKGRLGIYKNTDATNDLSVADSQKMRLDQHGGNLQQERMIKDKRRSLEHAVNFSYQAAKVTKDNENIYKALINPNRLKQDYDDKIISIGFESGYKIGDIFNWIGTNTYWIIYLQDLTELAYFRGDIRKCSYEISWEDKEGNKLTTHAAIKGPSETNINSSVTHGISLDMPNYSLALLVPATNENLEYFTRYNKFYLKNNTTCWRIEATDNISTPGIIEVYVKEYYANETEDDIVEGIVGGLIEKQDPIPQDSEIIGETFIKVKKIYEYEFAGVANADWRVQSSLPVELTTAGKKATIKWLSSYSGQFELFYGDFSKTIVVESLF